jgi:hypothetical protein
MVESFSWLEYLAVYSSSIFKFIAGPVLGSAYGLPFWLSALLTALGMMTAIVISGILGKQIKAFLHRYFFKKKKRFSPNNRRFVKIWASYGVPGVAMLTPLIFSPFGGGLLVSTIGANTQKIFVWMAFSSLFWGLIFSATLVYLKPYLEWIIGGL